MKVLKPLDFLIFASISAAAVLFTVKAFTQKGTIVKVTANGQQYEYSLKKDGLYTVNGLLGPAEFEIKNGKFRITSSPCPEKICQRQGFSSPLVCLPNKVIISLEDSGEFDALSE